VNVKATKAGTKDAEYTVIAARQNSDLSEAEKAVMTDLKPVDEILSAMKEKSKARFMGTPQQPVAQKSQETVTAKDFDVIDYPNDDINPEDIPFN